MARRRANTNGRRARLLRGEFAFKRDNGKLGHSGYRGEDYIERDVRDFDEPD